MPMTKISVPRHLEKDKVRALAAAVQDGLVNTCNVPPNDLFQLISRFDADDMILDPHFGGVNRSRDACVVEVIFLEGARMRKSERCFAMSQTRLLALDLGPMTS